MRSLEAQRTSVEEIEQDSEMRKLSQAAVVRQILEARYTRKKAA
jgi:hypothetical protein